NTKFDASGYLINPTQYGPSYSICSSKYLFNNATRNFLDSWTFCCSIGKKLVSFETVQEYDCFKNYNDGKNGGGQVLQMLIRVIHILGFIIITMPLIVDSMILPVQKEDMQFV
ncbi:hypothetical protein B566_EDAN016054, partial [Ephemera danica]